MKLLIMLFLFVCVFPILTPSMQDSHPQKVRGQGKYIKKIIWYWLLQQIKQTELNNEDLSWSEQVTENHKYSMTTLNES